MSDNAGSNLTLNLNFNVNLDVDHDYLDDDHLLAAANDIINYDFNVVLNNRRPDHNVRTHDDAPSRPTLLGELLEPGFG